MNGENLLRGNQFFSTAHCKSPLHQNRVHKPPVSPTQPCRDADRTAVCICRSLQVTCFRRGAPESTQMSTVGCIKKLFPVSKMGCGDTNYVIMAYLEATGWQLILQAASENVLQTHALWCVGKVC